MAHGHTCRLGELGPADKAQVREGVRDARLRHQPPAAAGRRAPILMHAIAVPDGRHSGGATPAPYKSKRTTKADKKKYLKSHCDRE